MDLMRQKKLLALGSWAVVLLLLCSIIIGFSILCDFWPCCVQPLASNARLWATFSVLACLYAIVIRVCHSESLPRTYAAEEMQNENALTFESLTYEPTSFDNKPDSNPEAEICNEPLLTQATDARNPNAGVRLPPDQASSSSASAQGDASKRSSSSKITQWIVEKTTMMKTKEKAKPKIWKPKAQAKPWPKATGALENDEGSISYGGERYTPLDLVDFGDAPSASTENRTIGYQKLPQQQTVEMEEGKDKEEEDRTLELFGFLVCCGVLVITPIVCLYNAVQIGEGPPGILSPEVVPRSRAPPPHLLDTIDGWTLTNWTKCSTSCGQGKSTRTAKCQMTGRMCSQGVCTNRHELKNDTKYKCGPDPTTEQPCADYTGCQWRTSLWSECMSECGAGKKERSVTCMSEESKEGDDLGDAACATSEHLGPKPYFFKFCSSSKYCDWTLGDWALCSTTCGTGIQTRNVTCPVKGCPLGEWPAKEKPCKDTSGCLWSAWEKCNVMCGVGTRIRRAQCITGAQCNVSDLPMESSSCSGSECQWVVGDWSRCSTEGSDGCQEGVQNRSVSCLSSDASLCKGQKQNDTRTCKAGIGCKSNIDEDEKVDVTKKEARHRKSPLPTVCRCIFVWPFGLFAGFLSAMCSWGWAMGLLVAISFFRPQGRQTVGDAYVNAVMAPQAAPLGLLIAGIVSVFVEARPSEAHMNNAMSIGTCVFLILVPVKMVAIGLQKGRPRSQYREMDRVAVAVLSVVLCLFHYMRSGGEWGTKKSM